MKIYLMRHGETEYNIKGLIQGRLDIPLNANGIRLAEMTRDGFRREELTFDMAYCSPLMRARKTADIILEGQNTPIVYDDRICEMNFGEGEGISLKEATINPAYANIKNLFKNPKAYQATENGESYEDLFQRVQDFLEHEIYPNEYKYENVFICCHGGIIRAFLAFMKKLDLDQFWNNHQPNCSVNIIQIKNHQIFILEEHKLYYELPKSKEGMIL